MKVTKVTKSWGSKGMGAEVSVWMPAATYGTLETLASGKAIQEIDASLEIALRDTIRDAFPALRQSKFAFDTTKETYDDGGSV